MNNINNVILIGRLTKDPENKKLPNGTSCTRFSIAVNRSVKKNDSWSDEVSYFDVYAYAGLADTVVKYCKKGKQVGVSGELKQDRWEKEGQKHSRVVVNAKTVQFLGEKEQSNDEIAEEIF